MIVKELKGLLETVDENAEVIIVVYTNEGFEAGYIDRVDPHCKYNCITGERLGEDETLVEITTSTKRRE